MKTFTITEDVRKVLDMRGKKVKCKVSNLTGICDGVLIPMNGENRLSVQPQAADGQEVKQSYWVDITTIEILENDTGLKGVEPREGLIDLGVIVKDKISGFTGTVTSKSIHINGCVTNSLTGEFIKDKNELAFVQVPEDRCEAIEVKIPKEEVTQSKSRGGPTTVNNSFTQRK